MPGTQSNMLLHAQPNSKPLHRTQNGRPRLHVLAAMSILSMITVSSCKCADGCAPLEQRASLTVHIVFSETLNSDSLTHTLQSGHTWLLHTAHSLESRCLLSSGSQRISSAARRLHLFWHLSVSLPSRQCELDASSLDYSLLQLICLLNGVMHDATLRTHSRCRPTVQPRPLGDGPHAGLLHSYSRGSNAARMLRARRHAR